MNRKLLRWVLLLFILALGPSAASISLLAQDDSAVSLQAASNQG